MLLNKPRAVLVSLLFLWYSGDDCFALKVAPYKRLSELDAGTKLGPACPPEVNYGPHCICDFWPYDTFDVYCNVSSTKDLEDITQAFYVSPIVDHTEVVFNFFAPNMSIPKNVLGDKTAKTLKINCNDGFLGLIDSQAFIHSEGTASAFEISSCNLNGDSFDFYFLTQLRMLHTLIIRNCALTSFKNFPFNPHMENIELYSIQGLQSWYEPSRTPVVNTITISGVYNVTSEAVEQIIESLFHYNYFLRRLFLINLGLTRVPEILRNFTSLTILDLSENKMQELPAKAFDLQSSLETLVLWNIPIHTIYPQAFEGNYRATSINLVYNNLTRFDKDVFRDLLVDMMQAYGSVYLYGSPINCNDCHLSWLINDERYLLTRIQGGTCDNMTYFEELDPEAYNLRCAKDSSPRNTVSVFNVIIITLGFYCMVQPITGKF